MTFQQNISNQKWFSVSTFKIIFGLCACLVVANCSSSKSMFPSSKYGVKASPKVVGLNEHAPKGGGKQMVGKPYTVAGKTYYPGDKEKGWSQTGYASYYGREFHGRKTANGEVFDYTYVTAAHLTMPLPSYARVTNLANGRSLIVRVNDRGPFHSNRVMDLSQKSAELLDFKRSGTAHVKLEYMGRASLAGSDDRKLANTLRTDGRLAQLPDAGAEVRYAVAAKEDVQPSTTQVEQQTLVKRVDVASTSDTAYLNAANASDTVQAPKVEALPSEPKTTASTSAEPSQANTQDEQPNEVVSVAKISNVPVPEISPRKLGVSMNGNAPEVVKTTQHSIY